MGRTVLLSLLIVSASALGAAAQQSRGLTPRGGMWQSVPYADEERERASRLEPSAPAIAAPPKIKRTAAQPKSMPRTQRNPVAAATPLAEPARPGAAAKTRELSRRIEALAPGTKLDQPITDPENPAWRRGQAGRPGPDGRAFAVPLDDSGRSGFIARGFHQDPTWENPRGNTGATFGVRTKF
jgi:hypothetical protein